MTRTALRARLIAESLDPYSAVGQHAIEVAQVLRGEGYALDLWLQNPRLTPAEWRSLVTDPADLYPLPADLTILEYPIWFPLAERFRQAGGAAVFWYHGVTPPGLWGAETEGDILRRSEAGAELAWHAHLAVADSPFMAQELHRHSGYPVERIRVIPLGVRLEHFAEPLSDGALAQLRQQWRLGTGRVLLYVGRVSPHKRLDLAVEALAQLASRYPDLRLVIVGDTVSTAAYRNTADRLRAQAAAKGLADRVIFTGRVPATRPFYGLADICLLPSQHEGFGVPLVEAMAAGVVVIASASGAMPWVLAAEGTGEPAGLTFTPGSAEALASCIAAVLDDVELRHRLIQRGRERALSFGMEQFAQRTRQLLAEAIDLARQGPPPAADRPTDPLWLQADVALREYRVRSHVPLLGPLIARLRTTLTSHLKEAYLDRIVEQQVLFNRALAAEIGQLRAENARLRDEIARLRQAIATAAQDKS